MTAETSDHLVKSSRRPPFFQRVDWLAFGLATFLSLVVYWFSLPPEIEFDDAGAYATTALYPGPSIPPGRPVWVLYGWLFMKLIPFSNVAWRLALSSAVAGAITCGLIALLVSRTGSFAFADSPGFKNLTLREQKTAGLVCGIVAGLGFGFSSLFWSKAVRPDPYAFSLLLFAVTIILVTHWFFAPARKSSFALAFFTGSLAMVENADLWPVILGLWLLVVLAERKISRDVFLCVGIFLWWLIWQAHREYSPAISNLVFGYGPFIFIAATVAIALGGVFWWQTRKAFTEWKILLLAGMMFLIGQCAHFLLPVYSMTTPPVNWGYPRTVEGFFHMTSRGTYCGPEVVYDPSELASRTGLYFLQTGKDYGFIYMFMAAIATLCWWKTSSAARRWQAGLLLAWLFSSLQILMSMHGGMLIPGAEKSPACCAVTHLTLAIFSGLGLMHIVACCAKPMPDLTVKPATAAGPQPNPVTTAI